MTITIFAPLILIALGSCFLLHLVRYLYTETSKLRDGCYWVSHRFFTSLPEGCQRFFYSPMQLAGRSREYIEIWSLTWIGLLALNSLLLLSNPTSTVLATVIVVMLLVSLPRINAGRAAKLRRQQAVHSLPTTMDNLAMLLQAGFPLLTALKMHLEDCEESILAGELKKVLSQVKTGISFSLAIERLYESLPCSEIRLLVNLLMQSSKHGSSLSGLLYQQASIRREALEAEIEQYAQEAPVRMLAPLAFMIFPAAMLPFIGLIWVKLS